MRTSSCAKEWILWTVYGLLGVALVLLGVVHLGCGGVEVTRGVEFKDGGAYYTARGTDQHELYVGASGDMVFNVGTFTFGTAERLRINPEGDVFSQTELIVRLEETLDKGLRGDVYFEVKAFLVFDRAHNRQEVCFDVEALGFDVQPFCQPLPWLEPDEQTVEGSYDPGEDE